MPFRLLFILGLIFGFAQLVQAQEARIQVTKVKPDLYVYTSYGTFNGEKVPANGLIISTTDSVVLIDTPWDDPQTEQVLTWVAKNLKKPVTHCIVTHAHQDRMGGIAALQKQKVKVWSTALTSKKAFEQGLGNPSPVLPPTDTTFTIGRTEIEVYFPGAGHVPDNLVVWLPETKLLAGGCLVKAEDAKNLGNVAEANLTAWPEAIRHVLFRYPDAAVVVPGHGPLSDNKALHHTLKLLLQRK
ncbi:subclass B1 metallo-beta-lactamase [Pontibacter arcticus]|uniref:beta-lactamase n=1 Tax=Pontibacter arcticus TaxID=2080288 RepID=A0A364RIW0_9BACT|nr:subclass B1 metallo-beta-lactamase [Pontibacter arcticus]RAU84239.1 subclass B1 metallo-beta-lactamase [Pontibacter arcticus]